MSEVKELLQEEQVIQQHLCTGRIRTTDFQAWNISCRFVNCMSRGDVKAAIALLESDERSGSHMSLDAPLASGNPSWTVSDELLKHPCNGTASSFFSHWRDVQRDFILLYLRCLMEPRVEMQLSWCGRTLRFGCFWLRRLCISFQGESDDLCRSLALVAHRLCTSQVDPRWRRCHGCLLFDCSTKCPGVCPIGVGEGG